VVFEQVEGKTLFRSFQPGMQSGNCTAVAKDARQDFLVCLTGHMGQGILESGVALMRFTPTAGKEIDLSMDMLLTAEDTTGAFGAHTVTCKMHPPRYFELSKLGAGPRPMTVGVEASWADAETMRTACGKGFPKPKEAIGDLAPGDAWVPDGQEKRGKLTIDLATRRVVGQ
jgi:hypothetical protein